MSGRPDIPSATLGIWAGRLFLWPARALYVGLAADTSVHSHHAIQLCIGLGGGFRLRGAPGSTWRTHELAAIAPDRLHQLDGCGRPLALVYIDPEADDGRRLATVASRTTFGLGRRDSLDSVIGGLRGCGDASGDATAAAAAVDALLDHLAPRHVGRRMPDARIGRILDRVRSTPCRPSAAEAASLLALSSHRFQHLFRDSTGIPFRRYLLWLRLVAAIETIARGASLTGAAHAAGFADSAHLSRTFRRMFGLTPSLMAKSSEFVQAPARRMS